LGVTSCTCGFLSSAVAKFCGGCGRPLNTESRSCPRCVGQSAWNARFCEHCAAPLESAPGTTASVQPAHLVQSKPTEITQQTGAIRLRRSEIRVVSTVVSIGDDTMRLAPRVPTETPIDVELPFPLTKTQYTRGMNRFVLCGDYVEVVGRMPPGHFLRPAIIINLTTGVSAYSRLRKVVWDLLLITPQVMACGVILGVIWFLFST